jgi:hypothetical protein
MTLVMAPAPVFPQAMQTIAASFGVGGRPTQARGPGPGSGGAPGNRPHPPSRPSAPSPPASDPYGAIQNGMDAYLKE